MPPLSFMNPEWVGYIGAFFTSSCLVPQVVKVLREKHTKSLSLGMYLLNGMGIIAWLYYGILIDSSAILLANTITMVMVATIIVMKLKYG